MNDKPKPIIHGLVIPFVLCFAWIFVFGQLVSSFTITDDAYIAYRYSENLANGNGPAWNIGEKVEGYTSFLHMALCAGAISLDIPPDRFSQILGILSLAMICALGYWRLCRDNQKTAALLFAVYFATNPAFLAWAYSGLETVFFVALLFGATLAFEWEIGNKKVPALTAFLTVSAALTRPEGMMLGLVFGICILIYSKEKLVRNLAVYALIAGAPFVTYFAWRYQYFGYFYPNTYYAKVDGFSLPILFRGLGYIFKGILGFIFPVVTLYWLTKLFKLRKQFAFGTKIQLIVCGAISLQIVLAGGDFMAFGRFMLTILPGLALVTAGLYHLNKTTPAIAGESTEKTAESRKTGSKTQAAQTWMVLGILALNFFNPVMIINFLKYRGGVVITKIWGEQGKILGKHTPPDTELAAAGIGALGWFSKRQLVDIVGLTDEAIAHSPVKTGVGWAGHEKHNTDYLMTRKPHLILVCNVLGDEPMDENVCRESMKFRVKAAKLLLADERFINNYTFASMPARDRFLSGFLRKDLLNSPGYAKWVPFSKTSNPDNQKKNQ